MVPTRPEKLLIALLLAALLAVLAAPATAKMRSEKIGRNVCLTTGGAKIVPIPGFPGERVDRRLLDDIRYLRKRYKIFITDGYSNDDVHAANGEHPLGLALDIVPDAAAGGTWRDISALARYAEPRQDQPIAPFRWVGYNGDAGHGRGNHLHLSWNHSDTRPGRSPASVYTLRCPSTGGSTGDGGGKSGGGQGGGQPSGGGRGDGKGGGKNHDGGGSHSGGIGAGESGGGPSGGVGVGRIEAELERQAAKPVAETGGVAAGG